MITRKQMVESCRYLVHGEYRSLTDFCPEVWTRHRNRTDFEYSDIFRWENVRRVLAFKRAIVRAYPGAEKQATWAAVLLLKDGHVVFLQGAPLWPSLRYPHAWRVSTVRHLKDLVSDKLFYKLGYIDGQIEATEL